MKLGRSPSSIFSSLNNSRFNFTVGARRKPGTKQRPSPFTYSFSSSLRAHRATLDPTCLRCRLRGSKLPHYLRHRSLLHCKHSSSPSTFLFIHPPPKARFYQPPKPPSTLDLRPPTVGSLRSSPPTFCLIDQNPLFYSPLTPHFQLPLHTPFRYYESSPSSSTSDSIGKTFIQEGRDT